jgi:hypothetical protein
VAVKGGSGRGSYSIFKYKMHDTGTKPEKNNVMFSARSAKGIRIEFTQSYLAYPLRGISNDI